MIFRLFGRSGIKGEGGLNEAGVSSAGEQLVRAYNYSEPTIKVLTDTTVTNFIKPKDGQRFVLTGVYASADRSINASGDLLEIYEASAEDSGAQDKLLFSLDLAKQGTAAPSLPPVLITAQKFINADRTNNTGSITVTISGYFVPGE